MLDKGTFSGHTFYRKPIKKLQLKIIAKYINESPATSAARPPPVLVSKMTSQW